MSHHRYKPIEMYKSKQQWKYSGALAHSHGRSGMAMTRPMSDDEPWPRPLAMAAGLGRTWLAKASHAQPFLASQGAKN